MAKILLLEDDKDLSSFIKRGLESEGHVVDAADRGDVGLETALAMDHELVVLDRMMPGLEGTEICSKLRLAGYSKSILMLTAKDSLQDKLDGLRSGADDYLTKPFSFDELLLRIKSLLRRSTPDRMVSTISVGELVLDNATKTARRGERLITLTAREYSLLEYLMLNAGTVLSRTRILNSVWNVDFDPGTKSVDVYIRYLREKIDHAGEVPMIKTTRGFGYSISAK
jgi:two-component system, OmpR family, response regulator